MTSPTPEITNNVTVLLYGFADEHAATIHKRVPNVRVLSATDATSLHEQAPEADILLAHSFPVEIFDKAKRLRWFQCASAGIDSLMPVRDRIGDLIVTNVRGIHGEAIADYVMTGIAMIHWNFPRFLQDNSRKEWSPRPLAPLAGQTLGVIGLGSVGSAIARRGKAFGMKVIGSDRDKRDPVEGVEKLFPPEIVAELLRLSDFIVLAVPQIPETVGLIGREEFQLMRPSAVLVNIARGSVVVESELIQALKKGTISGALLDVFEREPLPADNPLWNMQNVIVTPHVAGWMTDYDNRVLEIFNENLERFVKDKPLRNVVDPRRGY
ncbi:MAG: D-2-hydroxyacid dehydrogenase [Mesorhizobium sp.]|uniref:D-2-hydroxyacid dehydrogenase n=1 Tax=Mesorhizobium sp. TaxID=1871066 RepID=UPI000FE6E6FA|nr:D-2-hydroxyacid dehydrogenase [Mesorhizobium sp.]RWB93197.1 MAG: D-2-hydroxyacid dehydrogenase [Mesorhizobium sp.]RWE11590.1 MAG: D-2-hydroxyacid dehydrogenase [Mesorhizobium sp.]TIS44348.1 MAG: D-2-hydroxyacid dehydrogenase [Mesorhizobium sp.]